MSSPVAQFLDELVKAINSPTGQTALGGQTPARRVYQETLNIKEQDTPGVFIAPGGWRTLGRSGDLILKQQAVDVRLIHSTTGKPENEVVDVTVAKAEALYEFLQDFRTNQGGRVEQIIGPKNVDRSKLATTGQVCVDMSLDCDLFVGTAATDADPETPCPITKARNAVWDAVENWAPLTNVFARTYKTTADIAELQLRDPAAWELPAIAIYWGDIKPEWRQNRSQEWPLSMRLSVWVPGDRHTTCETVMVDVFDAIYRAKRTGDNVPAIEKTTGYPPRRVSDMTIQSVTLGRSQLNHALRADVAFAMRSNKDPFGDE